jgi:anti-anti-sigma factor
MEIKQLPLGDYLLLYAAGRVDNQTSEVFQATLLAAVADADVIIDFTDVEYISSAGFRGLMTAARQKPQERRIAVVSLNDLVQELFAIARFHHVIPIFQSVEDAAAAWAASAQSGYGARPVSADAGPIGVHFWGTRGSLPAPIGENGVRAKIREALLVACERGLPAAAAIDAFIDCELPFSVRGTFGGNTSCVEISTGGDEFVVCDLGTGVRELGNRILAERGPGHKACYNVFLSHMHWDHIMGFPFFAPAYIPGNTIRIHGCHEMLNEAMRVQQSAPWFPVEFGSLGATMEFVRLEPGVEVQVAGLAVTAIEQPHSGDSYSYRFSRGGRSIVYSTDGEYKTEAIKPTYPFVEFCRDAELLIFDAMYSLSDSVSLKEDWGHSNNMVAVELAQLARVKRLVLFHHEPVMNDRMIEQVQAETIRFEEISRNEHKVEILSAYDGMELTI